MRTISLARAVSVCPLGNFTVTTRSPSAKRVAQREQHFGIVPIAPIAQADRLLRLPRRERQHALLAGAHEILDAEFANLALGLQSKALFHLDFHPQSLAIEAVLVAHALRPFMAW